MKNKQKFNDLMLNNKSSRESISEIADPEFEPGQSYKGY